MRNMNRRDSLYKYTRLEFLNSTLNNGIFACPVDKLNDPYECKGIDNPGDYKVVCLSRSRNQKLMWSHYADGHRGCSIKISVPKDYGETTCPLKRVVYSSKLNNRLSNCNDLFSTLLIKDKKWNKELEVRAIYKADFFNDSHWKTYRKNVFLKVNITQVDFGCFAHFDDHYLDALIALRDYNANHKKKIKVRKYIMSDNKFEFIIDKGFNYINEIANIINVQEGNT